MTRTIAIITCFLAACFLIPGQGECCELLDYEPEPEAICCVVSYCDIKPGNRKSNTNEVLLRKTIRKDYIIPYNPGLSVRFPEARILNCVFRE